MTDENQLELTSAVTIYLGLGSNLGDRLGNLSRTISILGRPLKITRCSPIYETEPQDVPTQPKFLNMVIEAQTHIAPADLLKFLKGAEQVIGRGKAGSDQPRIIDIDILLYSDRKINTQALIIPHPRLSRRAFVLKPLADLAPKMRLPGNRKTISEALASLGKLEGITLFREDFS